MKTYFDTSVLLKIYTAEPGTKEALALIRATTPPAPFSHLLELELRNGLRLKHGRKEMTTSTLRGALRSIESDLAHGVLARPGYHLDAVYRRAETLSAKYTAQTLARAADIWHVAAALEAACAEFVSFNERQRKVAALAGLKVLPS